MSLAQFFVENPENLINGQSRVLYSKLLNGALTDAAVPASIADIIGMESPYTPVATPSSVSPWVDIGATSAPVAYDRNITANEWKIQQRLTPVLIVPQEIIRTLKIPIAETARADLLQLFENGPAQNVIAPSTGVSGQQQQPFGQFTDLFQYRIAVCMFQPLEAGQVVESGGDIRPRMVVLVLNRASLMAENVTATLGQGDMVTFELTVKGYAENGQPQNSEYGCYLLEDAGTIS